MAPAHTSACSASSSPTQDLGSCRAQVRPCSLQLPFSPSSACPKTLPDSDSICPTLTNVHTCFCYEIEKKNPLKEECLNPLKQGLKVKEGKVKSQKQTVILNVVCLKRESFAGQRLNRNRLSACKLTLHLRATPRPSLSAELLLHLSSTDHTHKGDYAA